MTSTILKKKNFAFTTYTWLSFNETNKITNILEKVSISKQFKWLQFWNLAGVTILHIPNLNYKKFTLLFVFRNNL